MEINEDSSKETSRKRSGSKSTTKSRKEAFKYKKKTQNLKDKSFKRRSKVAGKTATQKTNSQVKLIGAVAGGVAAVQTANTGSNTARDAINHNWIKDSTGGGGSSTGGNGNNGSGNGNYAG